MGLANACGDDGIDVPLLLFVSGKMCLWLGQSQTPDKTRQNQNECPVARMEKEWSQGATQSATRDLLSLPCTAHSHHQSTTLPALLTWTQPNSAADLFWNCLPQFGVSQGFKQTGEKKIMFQGAKDVTWSVGSGAGSPCSPPVAAQKGYQGEKSSCLRQGG